MCGIAGIVGPDAEMHHRTLDRMLEALRHRGPDEKGTWGSPGALLGVQRLAIVDPIGGHQPVVDIDADVVVIANGEIYGQHAIRDSYPNFPYRSGSDIEVVPALHRAHGQHFLSQLPGTFALALWEGGPQRLTLARDRFGERPLYWAQSGPLLLFASEPSALIASDLVSCTVNRTVLAEVLRQGYVPPGQSIWNGIHSLPHASALHWTRSEGPTVTRWWRPPEVESRRRVRSDPVAWFKHEMDRAVREQLAADVPVGCFLSGGIDSSTVAALASRHQPGIAGFVVDMPVDSEVYHARAVADRHGIDLHVVRADEVDLVASLHEVATVWGEPLADSSTLPTLLLSRFARESVKVALTGDGADELLGGYLCWARSYLEPNDPVRSGHRRRPWSRFARLRPNPQVARRYASFRSYFAPEELRALGVPPVSANDAELPGLQRGTANDIMRFDLDHYLPGDILVKTDRASMATGLEVRAPFLDAEVADGCLRLPTNWKVNSQEEKILLRQAFSDLLPPTVMQRKKQGFGSPMELWLKDPSVSELVRHELTDESSPIGALLDREALVQYADGDGQQTWSLLSLALWWRHHREFASGQGA